MANATASSSSGMKPFNFVRQPTKPASSSAFRASYNLGYDSRPEMRQRSSQARISPPKFAPGQSQRYSPATYRPSQALVQSSAQPKSRKRGADTALSEVGSEAGDVRRYRHSKLAREDDYGHDDDDEGSQMTWEKTTSSQGTSRGTKRGAEEVRGVEEEDSVVGSRGKRGKQHEEGESMDEDESGAEETEEEDDEDMEEDDEDQSRPASRAPPVRIGSGSKVMRSLDNIDDGSDIRSRRSSAKALPRRLKQTKSITKPRSERTLRDEMMSLDPGSDEDTSYDVDDSMHSIRSRRRSTGKAAPAKDIPDDERETGEEWTDPVNGLQWRMDEDEVMTEEEGSVVGRKRRVKVKRRVKRRLTVRKEMRNKWEMPADSLHTDKAEMVPHYVPVWLSPAEFEDAEKKGELGFQAGHQTLAAAAARIDGSVKSSPSSRARHLDLLFHQPANPTPLRSLSSSTSRSGTFHASPRERASTPQLRASAASSSGGVASPKTASDRISLSAAPSSDRVASPLRARALDTAAKRRREEELLNRLREDAEKKRSRETASAEIAAPKSSVFSVPTSQTEDKSKQSVSFAIPPPPNTLASNTTSAASTVPSTSGQTASSSPFSFGPPTTASQPKPEPKSTFSFGSAPQAAPTANSESKPTPAPTPAASTPFAFGNAAQQPSVKTENKSAPAPFSFGSAPAANTAPAPKPATQSTPSFNFNALPVKPSASTMTNASSGGGGGGFTFSAPKPTAPAQPASTPAFTFGAPASTGGNHSNSSTPAFQFGSGGPQKPATSLGGGLTFGKK